MLHSGDGGLFLTQESWWAAQRKWPSSWLLKGKKDLDRLSMTETRDTHTTELGQAKAQVFSEPYQHKGLSPRYSKNLINSTPCLF